MPQRDLVVIGASAGGLPALEAIVTRLPASLPAWLLVVMHTRQKRDRRNRNRWAVSKDTG